MKIPHSTKLLALALMGLLPLVSLAKQPRPSIKRPDSITQAELLSLCPQTQVLAAYLKVASASIAAHKHPEWRPVLINDSILSDSTAFKTFKASFDGAKLSETCVAVAQIYGQAVGSDFSKFVRFELQVLRSYPSDYDFPESLTSTFTRSNQLFDKARSAVEGSSKLLARP